MINVLCETKLHLGSLNLQLSIQEVLQMLLSPLEDRPTLSAMFHKSETTYSTLILVPSRILQTFQRYEQDKFGKKKTQLVIMTCTNCVLTAQKKSIVMCPDLGRYHATNLIANCSTQHSTSVRFVLVLIPKFTRLTLICELQLCQTITVFFWYLKQYKAR